MPEKEQQAKEVKQTASKEVSQQTGSAPSGGTLQQRFDPFLISPRELFSANPFSLMRRMSEEMDRVFGEFGFGRTQQGGGVWSPAIDIAEREGNYVVHADLPGLRPEDVKVEVANDALIIQGERRMTEEHTRGGVHRAERQYGQFYRSIPLPEGVNPEQVSAKFQNGELQVTVPMPKAQSTRRQIPIQEASASSSTQAAKA